MMLGMHKAMDPFEVLGLTARDDLTDDDVRAAWRRIATATHPDRADGGDPATYARAADAYARLRTSWDRGEALADHPVPGRHRAPSLRPAGNRPGARRAGWPTLAGRGGLLARAALAATVSWAAYAAAGWVPATVGIMTGAATWLVLTGRRYLSVVAMGRVGSATQLDHEPT
jgi:hypothetical protein